MIGGAQAAEGGLQGAGACGEERRQGGERERKDKDDKERGRESTKTMADAGGKAMEGEERTEQGLNLKREVEGCIEGKTRRERKTRFDRTRGERKREDKVERGREKTKTTRREGGKRQRQIPAAK
jgi:hypothetical protein